MGQNEIERLIRDLAKRVYRVENEVSDIGDGLHSILQDLDEPATVPGNGSSHCAPRPERGRRMKGSAESQQILRNLAGAGVAKVDFNPLPEGRTRVIIDGGAGMELSPALVNLLRVLCADSGDSADGLVGFKTPSEVARLLGKKTDKPVKRQAVREAVRRLRRALTASGYNPYLLQSDRRWGYRFALRRGDDDASVANGV
jgi:hypothetical protein